MRAERNRAMAEAEATLAMENGRRDYVRKKERKKVKSPVARPGRKRAESVRSYKARRVLEGLQSPHWEIFMFPAAIARHRRENRLPVLEARNLLRELHRAAETVGITLRFHDLRHVFASLVLHAGGQGTLYFLKNALGHSRASTTLDVYGHWLASDPALH